MWAGDRYKNGKEGRIMKPKMKKRLLPMGISDFWEMRRGNYYFVGNSLFIQENIESSAKGEVGKSYNPPIIDKKLLFAGMNMSEEGLCVNRR